MENLRYGHSPEITACNSNDYGVIAAHKTAVNNSARSSNFLSSLRDNKSRNQFLQRRQTADESVY